MIPLKFNFDNENDLCIWNSSGTESIAIDYCDVPLFQGKLKELVSGDTDHLFFNRQKWGVLKIEKMDDYYRIYAGELAYDCDREDLKRLKNYLSECIDKDIPILLNDIPPEMKANKVVFVVNERDRRATNEIKDKLANEYNISSTYIFSEDFFNNNYSSQKSVLIFTGGPHYNPATENQLDKIEELFSNDEIFVGFGYKKAVVYGQKETPSTWKAVKHFNRHYLDKFVKENFDLQETVKQKISKPKDIVSLDKNKAKEPIISPSSSNEKDQKPPQAINIAVNLENNTQHNIQLNHKTPINNYVNVKNKISPPAPSVLEQHQSIPKQEPGPTPPKPDQPADTPKQPDSKPPIPPAPDYEYSKVFYRSGDKIWTIQFDGKMRNFREKHGLKYIHHILSNPDKPINFDELYKLIYPSSSLSDIGNLDFEVEEEHNNGIPLNSNSLEEFSRSDLETYLNEYREVIEKLKKSNNDLNDEVKKLTPELEVSKSKWKNLKLDEQMKRESGKLNTVTQKMKAHTLVETAKNNMIEIEKKIEDKKTRIQSNKIEISTISKFNNQIALKLNKGWGEHTKEYNNVRTTIYHSIDDCLESIQNQGLNSFIRYWRSFVDYKEGVYQYTPENGSESWKLDK